ncbi:hypothetical protein HDV01_006351 [Terramyces sp. JEL0728]|nr:hypothetical protein HDV01_006351 [Terramyces sp. JEL0728]
MTLERKRKGTLSFLRKSRTEQAITIEETHFDQVTESIHSNLSFHSPAISTASVSHYSTGAYHPPIHPQSPYLQPQYEHIPGYYLHPQRQSQSDYYTDSFRNSSNYSEHVIPNNGVHTYADFHEPQIPVDAYSVTRSSIIGTDRYSQYPSLDNMHFNTAPIMDISPVNSPSMSASYHTANQVDRIHSDIYHPSDIFNTTGEDSQIALDVFQTDLDHSIRAISYVGSEQSRMEAQGKTALTFEQLEKQTRESAVGGVDLPYETLEPSLQLMVEEFTLEPAANIVPDVPIPVEVTDSEQSIEETRDQPPRFETANNSLSEQVENAADIPEIGSLELEQSREALSGYETPPVQPFSDPNPDFKDTLGDIVDPEIDATSTKESLGNQPESFE